ncbi:hypothetical protein ACJX0J_029139, partial [Zea mays]
MDLISLLTVLTVFIPYLYNFIILVVPNTLSYTISLLGRAQGILCDSRLKNTLDQILHTAFLTESIQKTPWRQ